MRNTMTDDIRYSTAYFRDDVSCFVPSCKKMRRDNRNSTFLNIPNALKEAWCRAIGRNCPKRALYVCEEHIDIEKDCLKSKTGKRKLKCTAKLIIGTRTYNVNVKAPQDPPQPKLKQLQRQELVVRYDQPGPSTATETHVRVLDDLATDDVNLDHYASRYKEGTLQDPLSKEEIQCRICGELYKDLILAVHKPYLTGNKATLALNDMSVAIDLNNDELPTVCVDCDGRLLDMFNFINHVKTVQESLSAMSGNVTDEVETLVIKVESPEDDVDETIDSDFSENAFRKQINNATKRKSDNVDAQKAKVRKDGDSVKKSDTTKKGSDNMQQKRVTKELNIDTRKECIQQKGDIVTEELMMDIKKEIDEIVENEMVSENSELIDTGIDVNPGLEQLVVLGSEMSSGLGSCSKQGESEVIEVNNLDNFP